MTEKEVKDFLSQYFDRRDEETALRILLAKVKGKETEQVITTNYQSLGIQFTPKPHANFEDGANEQIDLESSIEEKLSKFDEMKFNIFKMIDTINNSLIRAVLYNRYLNCYDWFEIMEIMGYSESQIYKIHNDGIEILEKTELIGVNRS